jgi:hypothetical protein
LNKLFKHGCDFVVKYYDEKFQEAFKNWFKFNTEHLF